MNINELITLIANVGFPVAITSYVLVRLEKQMSSLTLSFNNLTSSIESLINFTKSNN